jgi:hypothetical protein
MADIASTDHLELGGEAPVIVFATARFAATTPETPRGALAACVWKAAHMTCRGHVH